MIPDEEGFINKPLIFTFLPDQQDEKGKTMKLIDLNSQVYDACTNVIRRMETADLARPAGLTSAASLAYRLLFNGLVSEHGYGPDDPVEWATRSTRAVITIRELASEYRMLAETSEDYDTRNVLQDVDVALNTLANEIQYPRVEPEPEPEPEPKLEPGTLKCATHSTMIDKDPTIKSAYWKAAASLREAECVIDGRWMPPHTQTFVELLIEACATENYIHATCSEKRAQLIRAIVIVEGICTKLYQMWKVSHESEPEQAITAAHKALNNLASTISETLATVSMS